MGLPGVVLSSAPEPRFSKGRPDVGVAQDLQKRLSDGRDIQRIHKKAILAIPDDILGTAIRRGHNRKAACGGFNQGQAEGFRERRVDKDPLTGGSQPIKRMDILTLMVLGVGDATVKIIAVDI